jgi:hypothetical protein
MTGVKAVDYQSVWRECREKRPTSSTFNDDVISSINIATVLMHDIVG